MQMHVTCEQVPQAEAAAKLHGPQQLELAQLSTHYDVNVRPTLPSSVEDRLSGCESRMPPASALAHRLAVICQALACWPQGHHRYPRRTWRMS